MTRTVPWTIWKGTGLPGRSHAQVQDDKDSTMDYMDRYRMTRIEPWTIWTGTGRPGRSHGQVQDEHDRTMDDIDRVKGHR